MPSLSPFPFLPSFLPPFLPFLPSFPSLPSIPPFQGGQENDTAYFQKWKLDFLRSVLLPEVFCVTDVTNGLDKERKDPHFLAVSIIIIDIAGRKVGC